MARENRIFFTAQDGITPAFHNMMQSGGAFNKELERIQSSVQNLDQKQGALIKSQSQYRVAIEDASRAMKEARKEYNAFGDDANKNKLEQAHENLSRLKNDYSNINAEINRTRREQRGLLDEQQRINNRADSNPLGEAGSVLSTLGQAGLTRMISNSVSKGFNVGITSAVGSSAGSAVSTIMEQTIAGATIGSIVPGIGTAVGAGIGMVSGVISAGTDYFTTQDEAFKTVRNDMIANVNQQQNDALSRGVGTFANRQQIQKSFIGPLGSAEAAQAYSDILVEKDIANPFSYDDMASISKVLFAFRFTQEETLKQLDNIGNVGAALGLDNAGMVNVAQTMAEIRSFPTFNMKQMRSLTSKGIPVEEYLMKAFTLSKEEVWSGIGEGKFNGSKVFDVLTEYISEDPRIAGAMDNIANTYNGLLSQIEGATDNMEAAYGQGFIEERMKGLEKQDEYLNKYSELISQENAMIGQFEASLENTKEELNRDIMAAVRDGVISKELSGNMDVAVINQLVSLNAEYETAELEDNAVAMGRILKEAQILAEAEYNASEGAQLKAESERALVHNTTEMLSRDETYYNAGHLMGEEYSKGMMAAIKLYNPLASAVEPMDRPVEESAGSRIYSSPGSSYSGPDSYAVGLPYVPYDNFPALLHRGERVMTAVDNRREDSSGSPTVTIHIAEANVRSDGDISRIGEEVAQRIVNALALSN